jgi:hypothetical protein
MDMKRRSWNRLATVGLLALVGTGRADIITQTDDPFCEGICPGIFGFDVTEFQNVAIRFVPDRDYTLDRVSVWLFDINEAAEPQEMVVVEGGESTPSRQVIDGRTFISPATLPFTPELVPISTPRRARVRAGRSYWVILTTSVSSRGQCSWAVANPGRGWSSVSDAFGTWQPGGNGAFPAHIIEGTPAPPCVADVDDGSGTGTPDGGVTIDDLLYYLVIYGEGRPAADVDDGTGRGTPDGGVTIDDLLYFLTRYAAGC